MTNTTTTTTFKSTELGRTVELTTYVDPAPGLNGTDRVPVECGYCTNGVYTAPSGYHWQNGRGDTTWCFRCNGSNVRYVSANTARRNAKINAFAAEYADELRAVRQAAADAANAAIAAAEFESAWDAAHAEAARRAALVQGFIGEIGDKVTVTGTVDVAKYCAAVAYNRSATMFVVVTADAGQKVVISGSSASLFELQRGDNLTVTGKVKNHKSYRGQDQTVLSHAKAQVLEAAE